MLSVLENAITALSGLPTIGKKSAFRLALFLIEQPEEKVRELAHALLALSHDIRHCKECFNLSDSDLCSVCTSTTRDTKVLCVVEKPQDVITLESAGRHRGLYHVLGGVLSPINGITADKLHIKELLDRIHKLSPQEIIFGLSGSADADTTEHYIARLLRSMPLIRITRLARGLPAGMELEYADQMTLSAALTQRVEFT